MATLDEIKHLHREREHLRAEHRFWLEWAPKLRKLGADELMLEDLHLEYQKQVDRILDGKECQLPKQNCVDDIVSRWKTRWLSCA